MKSLYLGLLIFLFSASPLMADPPGVHGMLLFGGTSTYASHLPMFHRPHDYQAIFKLALEDVQSQQTIKKYHAAKAEGLRLFTLLPERLDLSQLLNGAKNTFKAQVFNGHFERGGENMGDVIVHITKVVQAKKLSASDGPSSDFLLFGEQGEYFAAHLIQGQPTYDAIMAIAQPYRLKLGICGRAGCPEPQRVPVSDQVLPVVVASASEQALANPLEGELIGVAPGILTEVQKLIYVETDELNP